VIKQAAQHGDKFSRRHQLDAVGKRFDRIEQRLKVTGTAVQLPAA
jgi:hypothetical protein